MPNLGAHCAISKQRTGFPFEKLHLWIDHHPAAKTLGPDHRTKRHAFTIEDMETIRDFWQREKGSSWGEKAVIEWLFHIAIDNISTAFKFSKSCYGEKAYNLIKIGTKKSGYITVDFDRIPDDQLETTF